MDVIFISDSVVYRFSLEGNAKTAYESPSPNQLQQVFLIMLSLAGVTGVVKLLVEIRRKISMLRWLNLVRISR